MNSITELVRDAISEVNEVMPPGQSISFSPETILIGEGSSLDSVGIVSLIVAIEALADQRLGRSIGLTEMIADDASREKIRTIKGLIQFIHDNTQE